eukprot:2838106-Pleurochrysis_carterae.AAC.2
MSGKKGEGKTRGRLVEGRLGFRWNSAEQADDVLRLSSVSHGGSTRLAVVPFHPARAGATGLACRVIAAPRIHDWRLYAAEMLLSPRAQAKALLGKVWRERHLWYSPQEQACACAQCLRC